MAKQEQDKTHIEFNVANMPDIPAGAKLDPEEKLRKTSELIGIYFDPSVGKKFPKFVGFIEALNEAKDLAEFTVSILIYADKLEDHQCALCEPLRALSEEDRGYLFRLKNEELRDGLRAILTPVVKRDDKTYDFYLRGEDLSIDDFARKDLDDFAREHLLSQLQEIEIENSTKMPLLMKVVLKTNSNEKTFEEQASLYKHGLASESDVLFFLLNVTRQARKKNISLNNEVTKLYDDAIRAGLPQGVARALHMFGNGFICTYSCRFNFNPPYVPDGSHRIDIGYTFNSRCLETWALGSAGSSAE